MRHVVAISGGKDSVAMALRLQETEPRAYEFVITPTGNELPVMVDHWKRLGFLLGAPLVPLTRASLVSEARRQQCVPNWRMRWCTRILKLDPFRAFLLDATPCVSYVGVRADEAQGRDGVDWEAIEGVTNRYPLVEWGWGIGDVLAYLERRGVEIPERTDCALCFFQRLPEWWRLWKTHPEAFEEGVALEDELGHTFRSDGRDTWPASLRELRAEFERGRIPKGANQRSLFDARATMCSFCAR